MVSLNHFWWLRIQLGNAGTWVRSLVWELRSHLPLSNWASCMLWLRCDPAKEINILKKKRKSWWTQWKQRHNIRDLAISGEGFWWTPCPGCFVFQRHCRWCEILLVRFDFWDLKRCYPLLVLIFVINKSYNYLIRSMNQLINQIIFLSIHFQNNSLFF